MKTIITTWLLRHVVRAAFIVTILLTFSQLSYSQTTYHLYGVTPAGRLFLIKSDSGAGIQIRSSIGSYSGYSGLAYYDGYFYLVTTGGDLIRYALNTSTVTYIGNAGYFLQDIAIGSNGTAYVVLSTNSDSAAESIAQISLSNGSVSNIVTLTGQTNVVSNMRGLSISSAGVIRGIAYGPPSSASAYVMQINPQTGAISPQTSGYYITHYQVNSIATHPSTGKLYCLAYTGFPSQALYELFERIDDTEIYIGGFDYLDTDRVSGLVFAPALNQDNSTIINYLLDQ